MGILEDSLITLENGDKIDVKELKLDDNIVLTCQIEGLNTKSVNKEAIGWSKINPIIVKKTARVSKKWKENINKYIVINNNLKLSLDTIILFKDFEGETTWGYSKSLRKGYFLFTDRFEYEEIKSIKRVKENVDVACLSVYSFSYYFVNGYLVHNTDLCGACGLCWLWPACLTPVGPHSYTGHYNAHSSSTAPTGYSSNPPLNTEYGVTRSGNAITQVQLMGANGNSALYKTLNSHNPAYEEGELSWTAPSSNRTIPWNYFPQEVRLKNNISSAGGAYFVVKCWDRGATAASTSNSMSGNSEIGWKAYYGSTTSEVSDALTKAKDVAKGSTGCPWDVFWHDTIGPPPPHSNRGSEGSQIYVSSTGKSLTLNRHSTTGISFYISRNLGTTWTWYDAQNGPSNIRSGSSYDGVRGDSKILVIFKVTCPSSGNTNILYRWTLDSTIRPHGWAAFKSYA